MTSSSNLKSKLKSVTNGRKYVTSLLKRYSEGDLVEDGEIMDLLAFHPTKKLDKTNVEYLIMRRRKPYNTLALFYKYKTSPNIDDISYVSCTYGT